MSELLAWAVGSSLAAVFALITVAIAIAGVQYAKQQHDPDLERTAKHALVMCVLGLILVVVMLAAATFVVTRFLRDWVIWLLVAIPWIVAAMNGLQVAYSWRISRVQKERGK